MKDVLRTAVVGLGRIGWGFHLKEVASHPGFAPTAVVDPVAGRREEASGAYDVPAFPDHASMLREAEPDLVVVASPTHLHKEQALNAFEAGADVFCDKPIAPTLADADEMIAAARRRGRKLMVYQPHRATAEAVALRDLIGRRLVGEIYMIRHARSAYTRRNDWQALKKYGGGMLNNYGAHSIDQVVHLCGEKVKRIHAAIRAVATLGDADDVVKILMETETGVVLDVDFNMAVAYPLPAWFICGTYGTAIATQDPRGFRVRYYDPARLPDAGVREDLAAAERRYGNTESIPWQEESVLLEDFEPIRYYDRVYDYFARAAEPFVPIAETREVMRIIEEARRSSAQAT
jgi:predicted dehydrogenase